MQQKMVELDGALGTSGEEEFWKQNLAKLAKLPVATPSRAMRMGYHSKVAQKGMTRIPSHCKRSNQQTALK